MQNETSRAGAMPTRELTEAQRFWLNHYQASLTDGKSMADYAREHGLAVKSFYYWKKRLLQLGAIVSEQLSNHSVFHKVQIKPVPVGGARFSIRFTNGIECEMSGMDALELEHLLMTVSRVPQ